MQNWVIDSGHSEAQFKVRHLAVANVTGRFRVFQGEVVCNGEDFEGAEVRVVLSSDSLDTNNPQRDVHLKSADFLDAEKYPEVVFVGVLSGGVFRGTLTIKDVSRPVELKAVHLGTGVGRFGDTRAGFEAEGVIRRKDFGLTWNVLAEGGGLVVGEEIRVNFDVEVVRK
jgi:polyisoprenoid-binding protein YceI